MAFTLIKENETTYRFEEEGVRFFLLLGKEKAILIDSGMKTPEAKKAAEELTDLPLLHILTHADIDHVSGSGAFDEVMMGELEIPNFEAKGYSSKAVGVKEGDTIDLGGRVLKVIDIPGHTPGSIGILDVNSRTLICGDAIQDGRIFMFGPMRNIFNYGPGLAHVKGLASEFDTLWPSHASIPVKPELIDGLIEASEKIISGQLDGEVIDFRGKEIRLVNAGCASFLCELKYEK